MSAFNLHYFLANPSLIQINSCCKDELVQIANHFSLIFPKPILKRDFKALVLGKLVEIGLIVLLVQSESATLKANSVESQKEEGTLPLVTAAARMSSGANDGLKMPLTLPRYDPLSFASTGSLDETRLKVRLARLQLEVEEKVQSREAQLKSEIKKLEIEANKAEWLRQLDLESQREMHTPRVSVDAGMALFFHLFTPSCF